MARELLSARGLEVAVKAATAEATEKNTRVKVRDGDNLMLIVRPGGGASWVLQYRMAGKRKPLTLGAWPTVSLKLARELAGKARELVAAGVDPAERKLAQAAAQASRAKPYSVRQLVDEWTAKQRVSDVYAGNIEAALKKDVLPVIGAMHPADVTRQDILKILRALEGRGSLDMLRRVRMWLRQLYEFALDADKVQASPVPTGHLKSFLEPQRGHFPALTNPQDVGPLMRAIAGYDKPLVRTALQLSAHVWQRPSEVRLAVWEEFDLDAAKWVIPADRMKLGREHWVPLSPQVVRLLRAHAGVVGDVGMLFPGQRHGKTLSEATLGAALDTLGYKGKHTPHGFRAMARTILEEHLKVDPKFMEKQLAHESGDKVQRAYNRAEYWDERVSMMAVWSDWLEAQQAALPVKRR